MLSSEALSPAPETFLRRVWSISRLMLSSEALSPVPQTFLRRVWSISDSILERLTHHLSESKHVKLTRFSQSPSDIINTRSIPSRSRLGVSAESGARNQNRSTEKIRSAVSSREVQSRELWVCGSVRADMKLECVSDATCDKKPVILYINTR